MFHVVTTVNYYNKQKQTNEKNILYKYQLEIL